MKIDEPFFQERIFELANGTWNLQDYPIPESNYVTSEFGEGSHCAEAYSQAMNAYSRICQRLQAEEWDDKDVEVIFYNLLSIGRHLSLKMFEYGVFFTRLLLMVGE